MKRALLAMAIGTFSLGICEFVMTGLLPYVAQDFKVSTAQAGYSITAYALGVVCGSFLQSLFGQTSLKRIMLYLAGMMFISSLLTALAPNFAVLLGVRFLLGLPHGCFFGASAIATQRLVDPAKANSAVATVIAGMPLANLVAVPLGTALADLYSWRVIYFVTVLINSGLWLGIYYWLPEVGHLEYKGFWGQFAFLKKPAPWLLLAATVLGNGGIFISFTYLSPLLTNWSQLPLAMVSLVMAGCGVAMVLLNQVAGYFCDRYSSGRVAAAFQLIAIGALTILSFSGQYLWGAVPLLILIAGTLFAIGTPQQLSIFKNAPGGILVGAALVQASFNLGSALGSSMGGIALQAGWEYSSLPLAGVAVTGLGTLLLAIYCYYYEAAATPLKTTPTSLAA